MTRFLAVLAVTLLTSCSGVVYYLSPLQPRIVTNIPFHAAVVTVVNALPDLRLDIIHDGQTLFCDLGPGQHYSFGMNNWSTSSLQTTVTVLAKDNDGRLVGTAVRSFWVSGYYRQSESWTVNRYELRQ